MTRGGSGYKRRGRHPDHGGELMSTDAILLLTKTLDAVAR